MRNRDDGSILWIIAAILGVLAVLYVIRLVTGIAAIGAAVNLAREQGADI